MRPSREVGAALESLAWSALDVARTLEENSSGGDPDQAAAAAMDGRPPRYRQGRKSVGFWTSIGAHRQLHMLALIEETTAEALLNEALNALFRSRSLPEIAPVRGAPEAENADMS